MDRTRNHGTVLVLGANGFMGSYLVDTLVEAGFAVKAFDRYSHSSQFNEHERIDIHKGDFFDDVMLDSLLQGTEYVFHTFSATTPFTSDTDPYKDVELNLMRNIKIFEKAAKQGVKKFVYLSSGGASYGHISEQKAASEADAPMPVSPYGIGKLASEYYLEYFNRKYGLEYIVYRVSNPYGPRQVSKNNQGVIPAFLDKLKRGEPLTIVGDGTSSRDYIYIGDVSKMIVGSFGQPTKYRVYNIGSGKQTSVNDIVAILEECLSRKIDVYYTEEPKTFLKHSKLSTRRFEEEFNILPTVSLKEGIGRLIESLPR